MIQTPYTNFFELNHKEEWREVRLGEIIKTNCKSIDKNYSYKLIQYLDTGSITNNQIDSLQALSLNKLPSRAKRIVQDNDIIYSLVRPIQRHFGFIKNPLDNLIVSTGFCTITANRKILDSKFLYYFLTLDKTIEFLDLIAEASTSAYPAIKPSDIENLKISLPPLPIQNQIAEILSSFDDKIDLLHRQNQTLESLALTLVRHHFIENPKPEWEEKVLSEIANFLNGLACQKIPPKNEINKLPVLKIKELKEGITESSDWATSKVDSKYVVENGDIIFAWSASLLVKIWNGQKCILNQHLFKVTSEIYPKWFCYFWCVQHLAEFISIANTQATTMGHIKRQDLDNAMCIMPDAQTLCKLDKVISPLFLNLNNNSKQIQSLEQMRDLVLSKIFNEKMEE